MEVEAELRRARVAPPRPRLNARGIPMKGLDFAPELVKSSPFTGNHHPCNPFINNGLVQAPNWGAIPRLPRETINAVHSAEWAHNADPQVDWGLGFLRSPSYPCKILQCYRVLHRESHAGY